MPTIQGKVQEQNNNKFIQAVWENLQQGDDGSPVGLGQYPHKAVQITGTLGGATVNLQGSMDGENWENLTDDGATAIDGAGLFRVWENPAQIRPNITGGDSTTDVTVRVGASSLV